MSQAGIRIGILGTGAVSQVAHLPLLAGRDDVEVVAVSDTDSLKAREVASRFEIGQVLDDADLIGDDGIDAVVVATPNHVHEAQALAALNAGKHVLVERPIALTAAGAQRLIDAAKANDRALMVGLSHRYRPDVTALRSFVAGGELGPVYSVSGSVLNRKVALARTPWRQRRAEAGGGALMDLGVQLLDLCLWLVGYPEVARVTAVTLTGDYEVEDAAVLLAESDSGIAISLEASWSLFADSDQYHARVLGREGSGWLPPLTMHRQLGGRPLDVTPRQSTKENLYLAGYRRLLDRFAGMVIGERALERSEEQVRLMRVIEAAYRSAREQREIREIEPA
ncbi:MAG: Gfo/Idh/MocA family oxidoreductase [Gemmatimonadota bacterium]